VGAHVATRARHTVSLRHDLEASLGFEQQPQAVRITRWSSAMTIFNLLPVVPLDGGQAMAALNPPVWQVGLAALGALTTFYPSPILSLILIFGVSESWRWRVRATPEGRAHYAIPARTRGACRHCLRRPRCRTIGRGGRDYLSHSL
jgi:hypothetical protein